MTRMDGILQGTQQYLIPNYGRLPVAMVRGQGSRIWDANGREYIDFFPGFGAGGVTGHCHPAVVEAVCKQAATLQCCGNLFTNEPQVELARLITSHAFGGKMFFCHSGAEANEAALKLCRLAAGQGRYKIISFHHCFHGRTMGALSLTPEKFQVGFAPMLAGNVKIPLGDLDALAKAMDDETAGVFVEPIQGEGGVYVPPASFMQGLRELTARRGVLLVCDEVWTAPARTGKWFGYQLHGIEPDIMTLGKACGGGLPVAGMAVAAKYQDVLGPGKHGCTMGGNPLCAAAGVATFKLIEQEDLVGRSIGMGKIVVERIRQANLSCVTEIRGAGLMLGVELDRPGKEVFDACMARGLLINVTQDRILRLAPAAVISQADLNAGLDILIDVLRR